MSLALVLFGVISLTRLPVRELPNIDPPIVSVTTVYPGANAQVVETEVTERLEETLSNIEGIKTLTSTSREQVSAIAVEFDLSRDVDLAAQDVRDRVARVRGLLPEDILEPVVAKQESDAQPIMWISVNSDRYSPLELTTLAELRIKNRLQTVAGVSSVIIGGEKRFAMRLWLDSERMAARGVTVLDVQRALREQNIELPSGRVENLDREMTIQTLGELKTAAEFNNLVVYSDGVKLVRLQDVGTAREGVEDERTIARFNDQATVFLGVVKQSRANTVEVAHGVKAELERLGPTLPLGVNLVGAYDSSLFVEESIREVWLTLGIAFVLVVVVIFVFLRNLRSTVIPAVVIPVSIVGSFTVLYAMGYSVNILTMLALVLAIGIVVDDAIVVLENIFRHLEAGQSPMEAAFTGMKEIGFAIITITVALVAVFVPLAFQRTATGRLFIEFAFALAGSVVISAFVALSLSPMMASRILRPVDRQQHGALFNAFDRGFNALTRAYGRLLGWSLRHRVLMLLVGAGALAAMVLAYRGLDKDFLPEEDRGLFICFVITPEGSTAEYTDRMVRQMERIMSEVPEIRSRGGMVAPPFAGPGAANQGVAFVRLHPERQRSVQEVVNGPGGLRMRFLTEVEGAMVIPNIPKPISRGFGAPFSLVLQNDDLDQLNATAQMLANKLRASGFLVNVRSSFELTKPELRIAIDRNRAAALGVAVSDISRTLQILFGGLDLSRIKVGGKQYDVIAQLERFSRLTPRDLERLYVRNDHGELIQLSSVVTYTQGAAPNAIEHYDRLRSAAITATPVGLTLGTALERVEAMLVTELPPGTSYTWSGESRDLREAQAQFWWILGLAIVIVYMVLASQFESLIHPFTVMLALPLAGVGAFGLIWLLGFGGLTGWLPPIPAMNFNLYSQIGVVLLVGLVTKNSILLVEFANQRRSRGLASREAMLEAGLVRLRPILMTSFSTIAGILPIAIGFGAGAESRRPMGVAVVGGLVSSTLLTLFIIPVVYTAFSDVSDWILQRKPQPAASEPAAAAR
jgi:hydrophobe/amphiphile efflux-1 (HAE1) family protein